MKTIVYIGTSLDGFIAAKDGNLDWLEQYANEEAIKAYKELTDRIDAIVIGKGTFEKVLSFPSWPYDKEVFLLSTSIRELPGLVKEKITVLSMSAAELLNYLSKKGFSTIYIDGGKVIQGFLKEDLIDELIISRVPVILGSGIPLFGYIDTTLQYIHIRTEIQSNGLIRSYYERKVNGR
ncbi:MAG: dihydrofolate reductase family protein [Bacteroidia bacterium]